MRTHFLIHRWHLFTVFSQDMKQRGISLGLLCKDPNLLHEGSTPLRPNQLPKAPSLNTIPFWSSPYGFQRDNKHSHHSKCQGQDLVQHWHLASIYRKEPEKLLAWTRELFSPLSPKSVVPPLVCPGRIFIATSSEYNQYSFQPPFSLGHILSSCFTQD